MKKVERFGMLIFFIFIAQLAGILGSIFTVSGGGSWYKDLAKPWFTPPSWVFGPVWSFLFILMGISVYLVWENSHHLKKTTKKKSNIAFLLFGVQLFFNALWSWFFFGLKNPLLAFIELIFLLGAIGTTIIIFYRIRKISAYLLLPYFFWVIFAGILNITIVLLN